MINLQWLQMTAMVWWLCQWLQITETGRVATSLLSDDSSFITGFSGAKMTNIKIIINHDTKFANKNSLITNSFRVQVCRVRVAFRLTWNGNFGFGLNKPVLDFNNKICYWYIFYLNKLKTFWLFINVHSTYHIEFKHMVIKKNI